MGDPPNRRLTAILVGYETRTPPSVPVRTSFFSVSFPWAAFVPETVTVPLKESGNPEPAASSRPLSSTPGAIAYRSA